MASNKVTFALALSLGLAPAAAAQAQDIDKAIQAYNDDKNTEAAFLFYDVIQNSGDADAKVKAEYYIAQALYGQGSRCPEALEQGTPESLIS